MRLNGFKIFSLFRIDIFIDYSWFLIFALITWLLSTQYFPSLNHNFSTLTYLFLGASTSLLFFASTLTHELAHSMVAQKNGIKINKITLFLFGGLAELFEEPADANTELKIAIAGPITSFLLSIFFGGMSLLYGIYLHHITFTLMFSTLSEINLMLAIFNLLPGFPLDGGRILRAIVWISSGDIKHSTRIATLGGRILSIIIIFLGVLKVVTTDFFGGVWLILIGLFLYQTAGQSYMELLVRLALEKVKIKDLMKPKILSVNPYLRINDFIEEYYYKYNLTTLPVVKDNNIIGIISVQDINDNQDALKGFRRVYEVMRRLDSRIVLSKEDNALSALKRMISNRVNFVSVLDHKHLVGILTLDDVADYLTKSGVV